MRKIGFLTLLTTAALVLAMSFPVGAAAPKSASAQPVAAASAAPAAVAAPAAKPAAAPERHPHIDEALESMRAAKHHLETADHDFDGHRNKAIEHLNAAIHEAEICMSMR
jgi:hypothetical protein